MPGAVLLSEFLAALDIPAGTQAAANLTAPTAQILPTRLLARIALAADPPLTALLLHRDLESLRPQAGGPITVTVPPGCVRMGQDARP